MHSLLTRMHNRAKDMEQPAKKNDSPEGQYLPRAARRLRQRWDRETVRVEAIIASLQKGEDWTIHLRSSTVHGWAELPELNSCPHNPALGDRRRDLRGLRFEDVNLSGVDGLAESCLDYCCFHNVQLAKTSLRGASLRFVDFGKGINWDKTILQLADLFGANLRDQSLRNANLEGANLRGADLRGATLTRTGLRAAKWNPEPVLGFFGRPIPRRLRWRRWTKFGGQRHDQMPRRCDPGLARYIQGENHSWIMRGNHPFLGNIWYVIAKCGYSPGRLLIWAFICWVFFGFLYAGYSLPSSLEGTDVGAILSNFSPEMDWDGSNKPRNWFEPYFFSAVTMTTLGYGEIRLKCGDTMAQVYVCAEVFLGYTLLAMLVGIFVQSSRP